MSTSTPPPYFPQNPLSPQDAKARRTFFYKLFGCLSLLLLLGGVFIVIVFIRWFR